MDCEIIDEFFSMLLFSLKIHWSILHFEWIFYPCIDHLESISSLNYVDLPNVHIFDIQFQKKSHSLIPLSIRSEKSLDTGTLWSSQRLIQVFQNSYFYMKAQILLPSVVFLLMTVSLPFFLRKCPQNTQIWITTVQVKNTVPWKMQLVQFTIQLHKSFSSQPPSKLSLRKCLKETSYFIKYAKRRAFRGWDSYKIRSLTALIFINDILKWIWVFTSDKL